jgi:hypothetical protein
VTLFVAGASPQSSEAVRAVAALLRRTSGEVCLRVIDVHREPAAAYREGVLTVPAAVFGDSKSKVVISGAFSEEKLSAVLGAAR